MGKTWQEKYNNGKEPRTTVCTKAYADVQVGDVLLITTPKEVDEYIRSIPKGEARTVQNIRQDLAAKHKANKACPLVTGICTRIVSEVAIEDLTKDKKPEQVTPFWRVTTPGTPLARKLSCGESLVTELRAQEGIQ